MKILFENDRFLITLGPDCNTSLICCRLVLSFCHNLLRGGWFCDRYPDPRQGQHSAGSHHNSGSHHTSAGVLDDRHIKSRHNHPGWLRHRVIIIQQTQKVHSHDTTDIAIYAVYPCYPVVAIAQNVMSVSKGTITTVPGHPNASASTICTGSISLPLIRRCFWCTAFLLLR